MPSARRLAPVAHVVVFGELSPRAKAQYTRFLVENDVKFEKRQSDGRYVANVSLKVPGGPFSPDGRASKESPKEATLRDGHVRSAIDEGSESDDIASSGSIGNADEALARHLRPYGDFIRQVGSRLLKRRSGGTYVASVSKLLRLINDIYDARADGLHVEEDSLTTASPGANSSSPFTEFVRLYLKNRFGLASLVELQALELMEGLEAHKSRLDVELFTLFLTGHHDEAAFTFFLQARDAVQNEVAMTRALFRPTSSASARSRHSHDQRQRCGSSYAASLAWLSTAQIDRAAQNAFGSKSEDSYLRFVHNARSYVDTLAVKRSVQEALEMQEFLVLAIRTFEDAQLSKSSEPARSLSSASGHDGHEDSEISPCPSPLPPPPPPRTLGSFVRLPVSQSLTVDRLTRRATSATAVQPLATETKPSGDDVQRRLSSLLMRMEQRQASSQQ